MASALAIPDAADADGVDTEQWPARREHDLWAATTTGTTIEQCGKEPGNRRPRWSAWRAAWSRRAKPWNDEATLAELDGPDERDKGFRIVLGRWGSDETEGILSRGVILNEQKQMEPLRHSLSRRQLLGRRW